MPEHQIPETLAWHSDSHIQPKRSAGWYLAFSIVSLLLLGYAVYTKSIITFLTFFLIVTVVLIFSRQQGEHRTNKITKTGIAAGQVLYPYKAIKKFWIVYHRDVKTLNFETTTYLNNRVIIQLGAQDPMQVKLVLSQYLPEDLEMEESLTDSLARKLKI